MAADFTKKTAPNRIVLECDDLDYEAIQRAMARRQAMRVFPEHGSNVAGAVIAEICRGWDEIIEDIK